MKRIVFLLSWFVLLGTLMSCSDDNDDVNPLCRLPNLFIH